MPKQYKDRSAEDICHEEHEPDDLPLQLSPAEAYRVAEPDPRFRNGEFVGDEK